MNNNWRRVIFWFICWYAGSSFGSVVWAQNIQRPPILGINYVAFRVKDLAQAINFYEGLLGYQAVRVAKNKTQDSHTNFHLNNRQHIKILDGLPAGQDERMLEIAFEVTEAEAMRLYLLRKGVKVPESLTREPSGNLSFVVTDPENHQVKFIQNQPKNTSRSLKAAPSFRKSRSEPGVSDRLLHVGITVADAKQMDAFYSEILGFSEIWRGGRPDNVTNWINMRVPDGTDYIEYMLVSGPVSRQQLGVLHHVALQVPSIQQALDVLRHRASGEQPYILEAPRIGRNNRWQLNLYDPDGTRVELMEPFPMR